MTPDRTHVILNPASGAGKTGQYQNEILALAARHLGRGFSLCVTRRPREATDSARLAIAAGAERIVVVGGDGTIQEAVNGFFSNGRPLNPDCVLGILSAGTGRGFAQSFRLPVERERQLAVIVGGHCRRVDIGRAVFINGQGLPEERYFVNECQAGIGGEVVRRVGRGNKRLGGRLAFAAGAIAASLRYPNRPIAVAVDGRPAGPRMLVGLVIGNGEFMAGGMRMTPRAELGDGLFDILFLPAQRRLERLRNFLKIYSGTHIALPQFDYVQGRTITLSSPEEVAFEADGELWGSLPCRVEIVPGLLQILSPGREA